MGQQIITDGGLQYVPQITAAQQVIYLDFDGATADYNGESLTIYGVNVADPCLAPERTENVISRLNETYAALNVVFVSQRPESADYSTIYVGRTDAFSSYGDFAGIAETIDTNNQNKNDEAFVMLDSTSSDEEIIEIISHEAGHLLGILDHGGEGLAAYAARYGIGNGVTSTGIVLEHDSMYVSNGGTANSTTVNSGGSMHVSSGGTAEETVVNAGELHLHGGTLSNTMVNGGVISCHSGTVDRITVNYGAELYISDYTDAVNIVENGGFAEAGDWDVFVSNTFKNLTVESKTTVHSNTSAIDITVVQGGQLYFYDGGYGKNIIEDGGFVEVNDGADVTFASHTIKDVSFQNTSATVHSNTRAEDITIGGNACLEIYDGGEVESGYLIGDSEDSQIYYANIRAYGGTVNNTSIGHYGRLFIYNGATANGVVMADTKASMFISKGGTAEDTVISGGSMIIYDSGTAGDTIISGGSMLIFSGGTANNTIMSGGRMYVGISGTANSAVVNTYGGITVSQNGKANDVTVKTRGSMHVSSGGTASNTLIESGGSLYISKGGATSNTTVQSCGSMHIFDSGTANDTDLMSGGSMVVSSGGIIESTLIRSGGSLKFNGGTANDTELADGARVIFSNGTAVNTQVGINAFLTTSETVASGVTVKERGAAYISGGTITESVVKKFGILQFCSGTAAANTVVNADAHLYLGSGVIHSGELTIENDATVIAFTGSQLDFTIEGRTSESAALVNDLDMIRGNITYSITAGADQTEGIYRLADNVKAFEHDVTLTVGSKTYEGVNAGEVITHNGMYYGLCLENDSLFLKISSTAITSSTAAQSGTADDDTDHIFLYKDDKLALSMKEGTGFVISSSGNYDHLLITENGLAGDIKLLSGGELTVSRGAIAVAVEQNNGGKLTFDYTAGDATVISGVNSRGTFLVQDDLLYNVYGENVSLSGTVTVENYCSGGDFVSSCGVTVTGDFLSEGSATFRDGTIISNCSLSGEDLEFTEGVTVTDSTISGGMIRGGDFSNVTISGDSIKLYGGTFGDTILSAGGNLYGTVTLDGTLTLKDTLSKMTYYNGYLDAAGNTIVLDYTKRKTGDKSILNGAYVSEDAKFCIDLLADQGIGNYEILGSGDTRSNYTFSIRINGKTIGTLTQDDTSFEYGNYSYTMASGKTLTVGISDNADETFSVLYWLADGTAGHDPGPFSGTVSGEEYVHVILRKSGEAENVSLSEGGLLEVHAGGSAVSVNQEAGGALRFDYVQGDDTVISGTNQYGKFSVKDDHLLNVAGENVTVTGKVTIENYHSCGSFKAVGSIVTGNFYGSGTFENTVFSNACVYGPATVTGDSDVSDSFFETANFQAGSFRNVTVSGNAVLSGGTYHDVVLSGGGSIRGSITLEGALFIGDDVTRVSNFSADSAINAAGHEVNLDLAERTPASDVMIDLNGVYNADLTLTVDTDQQTMGTYAVGTGADSMGGEDTARRWDSISGKWLYDNTVQGDLDGVITIRNDQGIELARCTVNGETVYSDRYSYRIYTENDVLQFSIGKNDGTGPAIEADDHNNNTKATATVLSGGGEISLSGLTIHNQTDTDWYNFTLDRSGTAANFIEIGFKHGFGDLGMTLYDASGNMISDARSVTDNEILSLDGLAAGDYFIKVYGVNGDTNSYTLNAVLPREQVLSDPYEKGDTPLSAHDLGTVSSDTSVEGAIEDAADMDHYTFFLERSGTAADTLTLTFDGGCGDLDLCLYDAAGNHPAAGAVSVNSTTKEISLNGLSRGLYTVKVTAANGTDTSDYRLDFSIRQEESITPDLFENNNTQEDAENLYTLNGYAQKKDLSIHSAKDVDYFKFELKETAAAADWISIDCKAASGDLTIEILNGDGNIISLPSVAKGNSDTVSLEGLTAGVYFVKISGVNGEVNAYDMSWNVTNSALIASDSYEGSEPHLITQDQTVSGLTVASPVGDDETRADVFAIQLAYDGGASSKIILTGFRPDWEDGMAWKLSADPEGNATLNTGTSNLISLAGLKKGTYYLTVDTPEEGQYSQYSLIAQGIPEKAQAAEQNSWSIFVYLAGDNSLEGACLDEILNMQQAVLPPGVEVYVLMDRSGTNSEEDANWSDTRVGRIVHDHKGTASVDWLCFQGIDTETIASSSNPESRQEWDTGNTATLEAFLDWGMKTGKADNYALIMKGTGTSLGFNSADKTSSSVMGISDITQLLGEEKYNDLKVVAFDQCLMGSDVVISALEGTVDYVVASEAAGSILMYGELFNSLTADMTAQFLAQKIVQAGSGTGDLTITSFHTADHTLSEALNEFALAASRFTRTDWVTICKSFASAVNYGDSICAYSDLGFLLNAVRFADTGISNELREAADTLYNVVFNEVIESTISISATHGSGLAVFNPVQSDYFMDSYSFAEGAELDYYGTSIGESSWGRFLYTVGRLTEDCLGSSAKEQPALTFTDFTCSFAEGEMRINYDLGAFYGDGVVYSGLYTDDTLYFTITLENPGVSGDEIRVIPDEQDAVLNLSLMQIRPDGNGSVELITCASGDGVLSLEGISNDAGNEYFLTVSADRGTAFDLVFGADWTSGSDYFDYKGSGFLPGVQGNGSLDEATELGTGNYSGLVTYKGDADYYRLTSFYSDKIDVCIIGSGLTVSEYDASGNLIRTATEDSGSCTITIAGGNYLYVEGNGDLTAGEVNSYSMEVSDSAYKYLAASGNTAVLPQLSVTADTTDRAREVVLTPAAEDEVQFSVSTDLFTWTLITDSYTAIENGIYYFKAFDTGTGLESQYVSATVTNIDRIGPAKPEASADITVPTPENVTVSALFTEDSVVRQYSYDCVEWSTYEEDVIMEENGFVYFRAMDDLGNISEVAVFEVANIDREDPVIEISCDPAGWTNHQYVTVTAQFSADSTIKQYCIGDGKWTDYTEAFTVSENTVVSFRAKDEAGNESTNEIEITNIDRVQPHVPGTFEENISRNEVTLDWADEADNEAGSGVGGYRIRYGKSETPEGEGEFVAESQFALTDPAAGTYFYQVRTLDKAGNLSDWSQVRSFRIFTGSVQGLQGSTGELSWNELPGAETYIAEYSTDNFNSILRIEVSGSRIDSFGLPAGTYQWRVGQIGSEDFSTGDVITSPQNAAGPERHDSDKDGDLDLFFAKANGQWIAGYAAQHTGILDDSDSNGNWSGTGEQVKLKGKNKLNDIFAGYDANILLMTDDENGDALFVDDIYSALPGTVKEQQARIAGIHEIRAGAGDDVVDMTSQLFGYEGDGVKIYGGLGNDTIWANNGNNTLFGDAGDDRIVGGTDDDILVGGTGNDSMHGGGGNDIFCFGGNWGSDTVEQLEGGSVKLWFEEGSQDNWYATTLTYNDGTNNVKVSGVSADNITLIFGNDDSSLRYDELVSAGCFEDAVSEKIFEDKNNGMLA